MSSNIIDGKALANIIRKEIKDKIQSLNYEQPTLAIILIGEHLPSKIYVKNKQKACEEVGIRFLLYHFSSDVAQQVVIAKISELNNNSQVHGILVQFPLPQFFDEFSIINSIIPSKDVDGFSINNIGKFTLGIECFIPCTALSCLKLIKSVEKNLVGKKALVIGRSNIVGRPTGQLLMRENCTITYAHSKTINLKDECMRNEIIVCAIGKTNVIQSSWLCAEHIIIDVGINRSNENNKIIGDVEFETAKNIVSAITPVPGGVGPLTIAYLLKNTLKAYENLHFL